MPLVYGGTTVQEIIYNGVNLDKVYYGTTLVFTKAKIFGGGNGQSIFNITPGYKKGSASYSNDSAHANYDASNMTFNVRFKSSGSSYIYGWVESRTKTTYDITQYSNATFRVTSWSDYSGYGTQHTCIVYGVTGSTSKNSYGGYNGQTSTSNVVVSLSGAKSKGDTASFYWGISLDRSSGTVEQWSHGRLESIILS